MTENMETSELQDERGEEGRERNEGREEVSETRREIDEATIEPESLVEKEQTFEAAEAVEAALIEAIQPDRIEEISTTIQQSRESGERVENFGATPLPIPETAERVDDPAATPLPIPETAERVDDTAATPLPIPETAQQVDEVSATPIPLPFPADPLDLGLAPDARREEGSAGRSAAGIDESNLEGGIAGGSAVGIGSEIPGGSAGGAAGGISETDMQEGSLAGGAASGISIGTVGGQAGGAAGGVGETASPADGAGGSAGGYGEGTEVGEGSSSSTESLADDVERMAVAGEPESSQVILEAESLSQPGPEQDGVLEETTDEEASFSEEVADVGEGPFDSLQPDIEQVSEAKEYWEPPEMYIYHAPDGSVVLVDADGKPIDSPPIIKGAPDGDSGGSYSAWYLGSDPSEAFEVEEFTPSTSGVFAYIAQDGSVTVVDETGKPVASPPSCYKDGMDDAVYAVGLGGAKVEIPIYRPAIDGVFAYTATDGSVTLVDKDGKPVESPPAFFKYGVDDKVYAVGSDGSKIEMPAYEPELKGVFAYTALDGSVTIVDETGKPIDSPPPAWKFGGEGAVYTSGKDGAKLEIPAFEPSLKGVYAYTAEDGTITLVDENGKMVPCPPLFMSDPALGEVYSKDSKGGKVEIPPYMPRLSDVYAYKAPDGSLQVVNEDGKVINSPPHIQQIVDGAGAVLIYASYPGMNQDGPPMELNFYKPISAHFKK